MEKTETIKLRPIADLTEELQAHELVNVNTGPDGELYLLLHEGLTNYREDVPPDQCAFFKLKTESPHNFVVLCFDPSGTQLGRIEIRNEYWNFQTIQPTPDGGLLLVCGRCRWHSATEIDRNARFFDAQGRITGHEITLGDGIADVQVTKSGSIWVSYFDEGVFGNFGWRDPIGAAGLNCFTASGELVYAYSTTSGLKDISDCYALNVPKEHDVWIYYYTPFKLVHLRKCKLAGWWDCPIEGAHSFVLQGDLVLMQGGYDERDVYKLLRLGEPPVMEELRTVRLVGVTGEVLGGRETSARGSQLTLMDEARIYRVRPGDVG